MFGLADRLGMTVAELCQRMSAAEFNQWLGYFELKDKRDKERRDG